MKQSILLSLFFVFFLSAFGQSEESNTLFKQGIELYNQSKYKSAITKFKHCQEIDNAEMDSLDSRKEYSKKWIAHCYFKLSDIENAKSQGVLDYDIIPINRMLTVESDSIFSLANIILTNGNYLYGINKFKEGLKLEEDALGKNCYIVANSHSILASLYANMNDFTNANEEIQLSKKIITEQNLCKSYLYGSIILREAYLNYHQGNTNSALKLAEESLSIFSNWDNAKYSELIDTYNLLAVISNTPVPSQSGENYILKLKDQINMIQETEVFVYGEQILTCCQGLLYFQHVNDALNLLTKSLDYVQRTSLPDGKNSLYISLLSTRANIYLSINRPDEALKDANQVVTICENTMFFDKNLLDEIYVMIADIYKAKNDPVHMLQAAKEAYKRASMRQDDRTLIKATSKSFMAGANSALENTREALVDIQETMKLYEQLNLSETQYYASGLSLKAEIEQKTNPQLAIDDCKKSISLYQIQTPIQYDRLVYVQVMLYNLLKRQHLDDEANEVLNNIEIISNNSSIPDNIKDRILISLYSSKGGYQETDNPALAIELYKKAKEISQKGEDSETSSFDVKIASCLVRIGKVKEATVIIDSLLLSLKNKENLRLQYANALGAASMIYGSKGDVVNMRMFQTEALQLVKEFYGSESLSYAGYLCTIAYQLSQLGLSTEAYPICKEAEKKMLSHFNENDMEMVSLYNTMLCIELSLGNLDKAIKYGEKARTISSKYDYLQMYLCETLFNLSNCYKEKCQYNVAIDVLNEAMAIAEKNEGRINMNCARIFQQLGIVSQEMGNYTDANTYFSCYYDITKKKVERSHPQYGMALIYESKMSLDNGNIEKANEILSSAIEIFEKSLGKNNVLTLEAHSALAQLEINKGNLSTAISQLERIYKIQKKENKIYDLSILNLLATAYGINKQYKEQINISDKILDVVKYKYGNKSQQAGNVYLQYANAYFGLGNIKKSAEYSSKAFDICRNTILSNFLLMTKNERLNLWNSVSNFFLYTLPTTCANTDKHEEFAEVTYNAALLSKGLLLQAETNVSDIIYNSGNENLQSEYNHFLDTKKLYNNATMSYSTEVDIEEMLDNKSLIDSLENEVVALEHALMKRIKTEFGDYTLNLSTVWSDVHKVLTSSDIAIEFMCATYAPDSIMYYALVLDKEAKKPIYIDLFTNRELEKFHDFKNLSEEELKDFYFLLWQPILSKFPFITNIYFTPCGELYNIPIESIPIYNGVLDSEKEYNFFRLSSTRELSANYNKWKQNSISLYGNIKYDASSEDLIENSKKYNTRSISCLDLSDEESLRSSISLTPLPGTEIEINSIKSLIDSTDITSLTSTPYTGVEASESSIKAMSGKGYRVLHIATHGFYIPENKLSNSKYLQSIFSIENKGGVVTYESPEDAALLRCGLYMAGARNRLRGQKVLGVDDGILTAREISMINLNGLDLAVLSACETGIGDISGDGVFGLQRGFKKAGSHSILMSLWKVDDDATAYLMKEFYNSWLSGKSKQESLEYAKKKVRDISKWKSTKFWSAFVLLDGIN